MLQKVKAAEALTKGDVVYISGGTGDNPEVSKANASDSTKMPALGIMKENLNNINDEGECITSGELTGVDLTGIATGAELFVSSATAGEFVTTAPTGEANLIPKIGKVINGGNGGALTVLGVFRTNAVPNLNSAKIFLGNASNQSVSATISGDATISDTGVIALASDIVRVNSAPTINKIAVWNDSVNELRSDSTISIATDGTITLSQPNSDDPIVVTNSYNIGGGNIANVTGVNNLGFGKDNLSKLSVITSLETSDESEEVKVFGKQLSMHIAASNPLALSPDLIDKDLLQKEQDLVTEELKSSGKPEEIAQKISLGKMNKFKEENALLSQAWVMEPKKKVQDIVKELSVADLKIKEFYRIKIGE